MTSQFATSGRGSWPTGGLTSRFAMYLRHRSGLSHLRGLTKTEVMQHLCMEQRLVVVEVDLCRGFKCSMQLTIG